MHLMGFADWKMVFHPSSTIFVAFSIMYYKFKANVIFKYRRTNKGVMCSINDLMSNYVIS